MERETRSERIIKELRDFNDDPQQAIRHMTLYKGEVKKTEKYLYESDLQIKITSKKEVRKGKFVVRFEKKTEEEILLKEAILEGLKGLRGK